MYLYGVSTNDMGGSLKALLGPAVESLSPNTVTRLISQWQSEYDQWNTRSLAEKNYLYIWADGIYFNVRLGEDNTACILVLMGAAPTVPTAVFGREYVGGTLPTRPLSRIQRRYSERNMMEIFVFSREEIETGIVVESSYVVIFIHDPNKPRPRVKKQSGRRDVLYLAFDDAQPSANAEISPEIQLMTPAHANQIRFRFLRD